MNETNNNQFLDYKVNVWMRKLGFTWEITPGTPASPNYFNGLWTLEGNSFTQEQAKFWYTVIRPDKRWWQR